MAAQAYFEFDADTERALNGTGRSIPSASLGMSGGETDQLALDVTGSYRARYPLFAGDGP